MGHGNSTAKTDYNAAVTATKEKTPGEKLIEEQSAKTLGWAAKGDYRDPHEGGLFVNYADPAMLNRNRALTMNAGRQGISALGTPDPNYLAAVNENVKAHQAEGDSAQYESDIREGIGAASAAAGSAEGADLARKTAVLGVTGDLYKQEKSKPAWWTYALGGSLSSWVEFRVRRTVHDAKDLTSIGGKHETNSIIHISDHNRSGIDLRVDRACERIEQNVVRIRRISATFIRRFG